MLKLDILLDDVVFNDYEILVTYLFFKRRCKKTDKYALFVTWCHFIPNVYELNKDQKQFLYEVSRHFETNFDMEFCERINLNKMIVYRTDGAYKGQSKSTKKAIEKVRKVCNESRLKVIVAMARKTICYKQIVEYINF